MMTTVELAKKLGWRGALESIYAPDEIAYMSDANRCKFLDLLPLSKDNTIALEIGCGLGQHTAAIARRVKHLDVLEVRLLVANKIL
jgi:tRNA G46 methylase TrmB